MKSKESMFPCLWTLESEGYYEDLSANGKHYDTSCDNGFSSIDGTLSDNGFKFCPHCGGHIVEVKHDI